MVINNLVFILLYMKSPWKWTQTEIERVEPSTYCDDGSVTNYGFGMGGEDQYWKFYKAINRESLYKYKTQRNFLLKKSKEQDDWQWKTLHFK